MAQGESLELCPRSHCQHHRNESPVDFGRNVEPMGHRGVCPLLERQPSLDMDEGGRPRILDEKHGRPNGRDVREPRLRLYGVEDEERNHHGDEEDTQAAAEEARREQVCTRLM